MIVDSVGQAHPLSGVRILVGRARHQAGALSRELGKLGAEVLEIPFIEIRKARSFKPLDAALVLAVERLLSRNSRKTECSAQEFLTGLEARAAHFAL